MTTTVLSVSAADYGMGYRHIDLSVRDSIPTSGAMNDRDAQGQFRVFRNGNPDPIETQNKTLDFQFLALDGDIIKARAVDRYGNEGEWESYTVSASAITVADYICYIDASAGSDTTGDGTSSLPWRTGHKAVSVIQPLLTSGSTAILNFADDQDHSCSNTLFTGSDSIPSVMKFSRWGNGTNNPNLMFPIDTTCFQVGKRGTFNIDGCNVKSTLSTNGIAFNLNRANGTAADRSAYNVIIMNCTVSGFGTGVFANNGFLSGPGPSDRDHESFRWIAFQNVSFHACNSYYIYGMFYMQQILWRDCYFDYHIGSHPNEFTRVWALGRTFIKGCYFNIAGDSSTRFWTSRAIGMDDMYAMKYVTLASCTWFANWYGEICNFGIDTDQTGDSIIRDIRFVDCTMIQGSWTIAKSGNFGPNTYRIDFLECVGVLNSVFPINAASGNVHHNLRFRNCCSYPVNYPGGSFLNLMGNASNYASGCLEIDGCWYLMPSGTVPDVRVFIAADGMSRAELQDRITSCNNNHFGKGDSNTIYWTRNNDLGGGTLAQWLTFTASAFDTSSSVTYNTDFNLIDSGASLSGLTHNFRLASASGPLYGTGWPATYGVSIDQDGFLRSSSNPTAGPFEYGATELPEIPDLNLSTLTVLTISACPYDIGHQQVYFHLYSSVPLSGDVNHIDTFGEFYVYRNNNLLTSSLIGLSYSWIGDNGDELRARFTDRYGNKGQWESYTWNVRDNSESDLIYYVNPSGNNSNDGSFSAPFSSIPYAIGLIRSTLTSGETATLYIQAGNTYFQTSAVWPGDYQIPRLLRVLRYGDGSNPVISGAGDFTAFGTGSCGSVQLEGVDLIGPPTTHYGNGITIDKGNNPSDTRAPYCSYAMSSTIANFWLGIGSTGNDQAFIEDKLNGNRDFFALQNVTLSANYGYHIYGFRYVRYMGVNYLTLRDIKGGFGYIRMQETSHNFFGYVNVDETAAGTLRLQGGQGSAYDINDGFEYSTWFSGSFSETSSSKGFSIQSDAPADGLSIFRNFRLINWKIVNGSINITGYSPTNNVDVENFYVYNCEIVGPGDPISINWNPSSTGDAMIRSIGFKNISVQEKYDGARGFISCSYPKSNVFDRAITVKNCVFSLYNGNLDGTENLLQFGGASYYGMTLPELISSVDYCDYNFMAKPNSTAPGWIRTNSGNTSRAIWESSGGFDSHSSGITGSANPFGFVSMADSNGLGMDCRLSSSSSYLYGRGLASPYFVTKDGFLRSSVSTDPGAFEYQATQLPEYPELVEIAAIHYITLLITKIRLD